MLLKSADLCQPVRQNQTNKQAIYRLILVLLLYADEAPSKGGQEIIRKLGSASCFGMLGPGQVDANRHEVEENQMTAFGWNLGCRGEEYSFSPSGLLS